MKIPFALIWFAATCCGPAAAWDPVGDVTHPDRILRNTVRETGKAVEIVMTPQREALVQANAPLFEQWLIQSRNSARAGGVSPIPADIRQMMSPYYSADTLNRATYKIGDSGAFNLASLSISYGDGVQAVTLIDVIVFRNYGAAHTHSTWAHELRHIEQFRDWGTRDFALRYLRNWTQVEAEAYSKQNTIMAVLQHPAPYPAAQPYPARQPYPTQNSAQWCKTPVVACRLVNPLPMNVPCFCNTGRGAIAGSTGN